MGIGWLRSAICQLPPTPGLATIAYCFSLSIFFITPHWLALGLGLVLPDEELMCPTLLCETDWHGKGWLRSTNYQILCALLPTITIACSPFVLITPHWHWMGVDLVPPDVELMCPPTQIGDPAPAQCTVQILHNNVVKFRPNLVLYSIVLLLYNNPLSPIWSKLAFCRVSPAPAADNTPAHSFPVSPINRPKSVCSQLCQIQQVTGVRYQLNEHGYIW